MVMTMEETKDLEQFKHDNKVALMDLTEKYNKAEHDRKIARLGLLLDIAKAGGSVRETE